MKYECVTDLPEIKNYLQNAPVVGFDFETAPLIQYRNDPRASLDAHRACIVGVSLSVKEGTGIYVPLEHFDGGSLDLPMDGITEWLCNKVYEAMGKQDLTQLVLDMLMEYVHANGAHFAGMAGNTAPSVYGRVKKLTNGLEISILPGKFDEMLEYHGLLNKREAILRSLRSQRILRADQDRFDKRVVLAKNTNGVKCNQFIVPMDEYFQ